ncbi:hypothetical protein BG004_005970 [Podila humilis]|nr:hypothetical protein BG004_005970 [Podila humilis]
MGITTTYEFAFPSLQQPHQSWYHTDDQLFSARADRWFYGFMKQFESMTTSMAEQLIQRCDTQSAIEDQGYICIDLVDCLEECIGSSSKIREAIIAHESTLRVLNLGPHSSDIICSKDLQRVLCYCPQLRYVSGTLKINEVQIEGAIGIIKIYDSDDGDDDDDDHNSHRWACKDLVKLKIQLEGIPRPDIKVAFGQDRLRDATGADLFCVDKSRESRKIQRRCYEQLGNLKQLQVLTLSHADKDGSYPLDLENSIVKMTDGREISLDREFQLTCLEMTVESGLDLLAGLKELRELDITKMAHRIGVAELEWMQANWPRLEKLTGLFDTRYPLLQPGVLQWLRDVDPVWGWEYRTMEISGCGTLWVAPQ